VDLTADFVKLGNNFASTVKPTDYCYASDSPDWRAGVMFLAYQSVRSSVTKVVKIIF